MTLGCGSWGGNVTSDNVSPLHLLDIKRVAFEVRPVKSKRPAAGASVTAAPAPTPEYAPAMAQPVARPSAAPVVSAGGGKINREDIAAIVDKFLAGRQPEPPASAPRETPAARSSENDVETATEAGSMYTGSSTGSRSENGQPSNGGRSSAAPAANAGSKNGAKTVDFVSEDDVRRAIQKGEKIYINAKTIITPAARDMGEPAEIFAKR
jgi:hypothetical protein